MCRPYLAGNRFETHIHIVGALMCIVPSDGNSTEAHIGVAETPRCYFALSPPAPRRSSTSRRRSFVGPHRWTSVPKRTSTSRRRTCEC